jgi:hypothetical protein
MGGAMKKPRVVMGFWLGVAMMVTAMLLDKYVPLNSWWKLAGGLLLGAGCGEIANRWQDTTWREAGR